MILVILAFLLPLLTSIGLIVFCKEKILWWEHLLMVGCGTLLVYLLYLLFTSIHPDIEYKGYYVEKAVYYEKWDETGTRIVTYTVNGKTHTRTETYTIHHPEEYVLTLNDSNTIDVNKSTFDKVVKKLDTTGKFKDMHRHYRFTDGDAYEYYFDNKDEHMYYVTCSGTYNNPVQDSHSLFTYSNISENEAAEMGLYEYPEVDSDCFQEQVIGANPPLNHKNAIYYINAVYGHSKHIRLYVLIFKDKTHEIVEYQKSYWKGGNKNELVVCLGYDTAKEEITWSDAFSWCDEPILEAATKQFFISHPKLNLIAYKDFIIPYIENDWNPKDFDDFNYIDHEISTGYGILLLIISLLYCGLMGYWLIINDYHYESQ